MTEQDRQKMKEAIKKATELNRSLLEEFENLLNENKQLEDENKKWREYYETGSNLYKRNKTNQFVEYNRERTKV